MQTKAFRPAAALLLLALGLALRLWHAGSDPLWLDEAYSAFAADHDLAFLWRVVPVYETHPPVYYTLLHAWAMLFGDGVPALRAFGLLASAATLAAMAWAADEAGRWLGWERERRRWLVFAAFGLACLSLAMVEMARQVRPYPLMILVYAAATASLLRIGRAARLPRGAFMAYLPLVEAMLWLHNLGPLYAVALTGGLAIVLPWRRLDRCDLAWLAAGHMLAAAAYLPGLLILHDQSTAWRESTWLRFRLDQTLLDHMMTLYGVPGPVALVSLALATLAARAGRPVAMLAVLALLPVLLAIVVSLTIAPVFVTRILTPVAAPALLLLAIGAAAPTRRPIAGAGLAVVLATSMLVGDVQNRAGGPIQDWRRATGWLARRFHPGDMVLAYPNEGALPLRFALRDAGLAYPVRPIPSEVPSLEIAHGRHPTGTRGVSVLPPFALRRVADAPDVRAIPTIWLLRLGPETFDPGDVFLAILRRDRRVVGHYRDGPIDICALGRR